VTEPRPADAHAADHDAAEVPVRRQLAELGIVHDVMACDPALADTAAFCEAYGIAPEDSANTILVAGKGDPPSYAACVVLATTRLDVNRVVRKRLGTRKASFASAEETKALTGMLIGGVTAFGLPPSLPIWVDRRVMSRERVVLGGGSRSCKLLLSPAELAKLPGLEIVDDLAVA
jgi:prolyl-tRNA editing enzyme YbaK/EbsC (Cys-tRNA(Pro) deacylase)